MLLRPGQVQDVRSVAQLTEALGIIFFTLL